MREEAMPDSERGNACGTAELVYPTDILADSALSRADLETFGAWMKTLLHLWREKRASLSAEVSGWARSWSCTEEEAADILDQLKRLQIADVRTSDGRVTVTCRRLLRREKARESGAGYVRKHRKKAACKEDVRLLKALPPAPCEAGKTANSAPTCPAQAPSVPPSGDSALERFNQLWWRCKKGELKELTFRKDGVKAVVLDASPEAITLEYARLRPGNGKCRALLRPEEADLVEESDGQGTQADEKTERNQR
jgi:hypothetical protein